MKLTPKPKHTLVPRQEKALIALLAEPTVAKAAESINVSERTLRRWLAEPEFERAYKAARRNAFDVAVGLTQKYAGLAVHTLAKVMADGQSASAAKVSAASAMLRFAREALELDDLAKRLDDLESRQSIDAPKSRRSA